MAKLSEVYTILMGTVALIGIGLVSGSIPMTVIGGGTLVYMCYDYGKDLFSPRYNKLFHNCGLENKDNELPHHVKTYKTDIGKNIVFDVPVGLTLANFESNIDMIEQFFKTNVIIKRRDDYRLLFQIIEKDFEKTYPINLHDNVITSMKGMRFAIGVKQTEHGEETAVIDYGKCEGHILINGGTGGGKSTLLRLIIAQAILKNITIHALDMKGTEITSFDGYDKLVYSRDVENGLMQLTKLYDFMNERNRFLVESKCKDIAEYNRKHPDRPLEYVMVIIDEFAPFRQDNEVKKMLSMLLSMARSAGMYFILSTQRIDSKTLGDIKVNMGIKLNMKAETKADSKIAMNSDRAFYLPGKGRLYMTYDGDLDRMVQVYLLDNDPCKEQLGDLLNGESFDTYRNGGKEYDLDLFTGNVIKDKESQRHSVKSLQKETEQKDMDIKKSEIQQVQSYIENLIKTQAIEDCVISNEEVFENCNELSDVRIIESHTESKRLVNSVYKQK